MCGIAGIINYNGSEVTADQLSAMMAAMKHRGPDDDGMFIEDKVGFGFVRLSIIDLSSAGHQPMLSPDGRYMLIFNGEIFNYIELREELISKGHSFQTKTDTEVLLTAYQEWGRDMLHRLNGMWAFVIYDREEKILFGARDRYGVKPFYYCEDGDRLIFASEIPSILAVLDKKPTANRAAIFDYLVFNRTDQTEETFFSEVKKLNHGHCFQIKITGKNPSGKKMNPQKWYDLKKELKEPFQSPEEFREMFSSSVGLRLRSDVPVGVCLSGGLDSSSIVSVMLKDYQKDDVHTFSAVYGDGQFGDESEFINLYKGDVPNRHFIKPNEETLMNDMTSFVQAHAEPVPSTSPYAQFKVMDLAKEHVTVTLDGQGADEAFAGYHYFFGFYFKDLLLKMRPGKLTSEMWHYVSKHKSFFGILCFLFFLFPASTRTRIRAMELDYIDPDFCQTYSTEANVIAGELYGSASLQDALLNHFEYKLEHLLKWEDRNSMWNSLEARVPFLDYRLVERSLSLGGDMIINQGMTKHILREAMKGTLPEKIRTRRDKIGFGTPQDEWFRTPLCRKYIEEIISSDSFAARRIFDVKKVKDTYRKHLERRGNYAKEIWKWIHVENWYRQFIDEPENVARPRRLLNKVAPMVIPSSKLKPEKIT